MKRRTRNCPVCGEEKQFHTLLIARGNRGVPFIAHEHPVAVCKNCGLVFLNPQHSDAEYERYYAEHDRPTDKQVTAAGFRPGSLRSEYDRVRLDFFQQFVPTGAKVLDIGSGYGLFLNELAKRGFTSLSGIEPSAEAARVSREHFPFPVKETALGNADVPREAFDAAVLVAVVEHFTDPVRALTDALAVLKPGGLFYVNTPNLLDVRLRNGLDKYFKFVHTFYFTEKSLSNCLRKAGFEIVASYTLPADTRFTSFFHPDNYSLSELNIIAKKPEWPVAKPFVPERERWRGVHEKIRDRWAADKRHFFVKRAWGWLGRRPLVGSSVHALRDRFKGKRPLVGVEVPRLVG